MELDSTWQKWLGEIQARQFSNSEFIIVVTSKLGRFANEEGVIRETTEKRAQLIHLCLLLWGIGYRPHAESVLQQAQFISTNWTDSAAIRSSKARVPSSSGSYGGSYQKCDTDRG